MPNAHRPRPTSMAEREMSKETMRMSTAIEPALATGLRARAVVALLAACVIGLLTAAPASAAPSWSVGIAHKNLYGVGGLVSPYSGSGEAFARESGGNAYSVQVTNASLGVGATLGCEPGTWNEATGFQYQWYRNGSPIAGATTSSYLTAAPDEGKALQCGVTGTNAGPGKFTALSVPRLVSGLAASIGLPRAAEPKLSASNAGNVGSVLTCKPEWGWRWPSFTYQWLKNGVPIVGSTSQTYTIAVGDAPAAIQCAVTGTNAAGAVIAASSAQQTSPAPSPPAPSSTPSGLPFIEGGGNIAGGAALGQKLTCSGGPASATLAYQWYRNGSLIGGATATSYTVVVADQGTNLQCLVTATTAEAAAGAASAGIPIAPAPSPPPPVSGGVSASGTANVGVTSTCSVSGWTNAGLGFTYQWLRNGVPIAGQTATTYTFVAADLGTNVQCRAIGSGAGGATIALSANKLIAGQPPTNSALPAISNATNPGNPPANGNEVSCSNGTWTTVPASPTFAYQWLRNGAAIAGATSSTYTVAAADEGKALQCVVTATNVQSTAQAVSANAIVSPPPGTTPPALTTVGNLTAPPGTLAIGSELTCNRGTWANSPASYTFQFLRNGSPIAGATLTSATETTFKYALTAADLSKTIQCQVTASNAGGASAAINATTGNNGVKYFNPAAPSATVTTSGLDSVSVSVVLPAGMSLVGGPIQSTTNDDIGFFPVTGLPTTRATGMIAASGWSCSLVTLTCTIAGTLPAGASFPPIVLHVKPDDETTDGAGPSVTVFGGSATPPSKTVIDPTQIATAVPFGVTSFTAATKDSGGSPYGVAGGHPLEAVTEIKNNVTPTSNGAFVTAGGDPKEIWADLPPGFSANPRNFEECPLSVATANGATSGCPLTSAVGYIDVSFPDAINTRTAETYRYRGGASASSPLFNATPEPGTPAEFAFRAEGVPFTLIAKLRSDGDYGLTVGSASVPSNPSINASRVVICANGVEPGPSLDNGPTGGWKCKPTTPSAKPFINNPSKCAGLAPLTTLRADSYQRPDEYFENDAYGSAPAGPFSYFGHRSGASPVAASYVTECAALSEQFHPTFSFQPDTPQGDSPAAAAVALHLPQTNEQGTPMTPALKKTVVTLPAGLTLNSAAGNGLGSCSESQIGLIGTAFGPPNPIHFDKSPIECPDSSKVGTLEVESPLLKKPLEGNVYLAAQKENPFGSNFAIYLGIEDEKTGLTIKLPGKIEADPNSGQLTTTFDNNPQLPLENFRLHFFGGAGASLATPPICGSKTTTTQFVPWSATDPDNPTAEEISTPSSSFEVSSGCANSLAQLPFALGLNAGSKDPVAGAATPFSFRITRPDGAQEISTLSLSPPAGLTASLRGVSQCSAAQIKAAEAHSGKAELASPSCPSGSQIGTATVGAGAGSNPYFATGKLYLAGPYKGAPLSVVAITPAVAGPFDLGDVVVRSAIYLNPTTARITAKTDPLPHILEGVPLRIRDIRVNLDRSNFSLNPTNCEPTSVDATVTGTGGATSNPSSRFQVGNCAALKFHPNLAIQLHGGTKRGDYQRLSATVTYPKGSGYANIARAAVTLPHSEFLAQEHIRTVCTRVQFAAHACPQGSIYGHAEATTPLLDGKLSGPVYLRSSDNLLPDLVVALRGPDSQPIEVELAGRVDSKHGGIRNTFEVVPDAPVSKFTLEMRGGNKSLIVNSRNLCESTQRATVRLNAQNGKVRNFRPVVGNDCGKSKRQKGHKQQKRHAISRLAWLRAW